jgi:hypothetical protein
MEAKKFKIIIVRELIVIAINKKKLFGLETDLYVVCLQEHII